jgi:hypothetical protein
MNMPGSIRRKGIQPRRFVVIPGSRPISVCQGEQPIRVRMFTTPDPDLSCPTGRQRFSLPYAYPFDHSVRRAADR